MASTGDIVVGVSRKKADDIICNNDWALGYCFRNEDPDYCWVKQLGTEYSDGSGWTTMILGEKELARRQQAVKGKLTPAQQQEQASAELRLAAIKKWW